MSLSVAFVVNAFPVLSQTFVLNQAVGLIERGHDVTILAVGDRPTEVAKEHPLVRRYDLRRRTIYLPKPPNSILARLVRLAPALWRGGSAARELFKRTLDHRRYRPLVAVSLRNFYLGLPYLRLGSFDVIHCQFGMLGLVALELRKLGVLEAPLVVSFRGYDASRFIQERGPEVYANLFREGDLFLPNCEHFRWRLLNLGCYADKIEILRSGIDCARFVAPPRRAARPDQVRLVAIGRLVEKKGLAYAIAAVESASGAVHGLSLRIIGDGPLRPALQAQIDQHRLNDCVRILGELDQDEVIDVLGQSDLLIAPSVRAADGDEDAPVNTLKEAMAMGLPVLATRHGGIGELVEDGVSGYLAPERDAAELSDQIVRLSGERHRWSAMGRAGRRRVLDQYDIEPLNDRLVELYQRAIYGPEEQPIINPIHGGRFARVCEHVRAT